MCNVNDRDKEKMTGKQLNNAGWKTDLNLFRLVRIRLISVFLFVGQKLEKLI